MDRCEHCDTRLSDDTRFTYKGTALCHNCTSAFISWLLDGGVTEDPDQWAWIEDDTEKADRGLEARNARRRNNA